MSTAEPAQALIASDDPARSFALTAVEREAIVHEMSHYEDSRAASIGALKIVQAERGWVPDGAIAAIAELIRIPASDVEGVATFYNRIYRRPVGRHVILLCDSIGCFLTGYEALRDAFFAELGIGYGQTTADNRFTLLPVCCLGACDKGPVIMIDDDTHGPVDAAALKNLLERYT